MRYIQINKSTKIWVKSEEQAAELQRKRDVSLQEVKNPNYLQVKKNRNLQEQNKLYKKFCNKIFREKNFISMTEFNQLILEHFNTNSTYYRKRMETLKFIEIKKKLIFPVINDIHKENNDRED